MTDFGRECKNIGGYSNFLNAKKIKDLVERTKEERKDKSEDLDLKIKGWTYRAKYVPFIFSGLAFAGMIFSIIISVKSLNLKTDKLDLQQVQQDLRQLKDHVELQDSLFRVDTFLRKRSK